MQQEFWQEVYNVEISGSLKTGECDDWCFGICRYWIFDSVRSVSVLIEGRI